MSFLKELKNDQKLAKPFAARATEKYSSGDLFYINYPLNLTLGRYPHMCNFKEGLPCVSTLHKPKDDYLFMFLDWGSFRKYNYQIDAVNQSWKVQELIPGSAMFGIIALYKNRIIFLGETFTPSKITKPPRPIFTIPVSGKNL